MTQIGSHHLRKNQYTLSPAQLTHSSATGFPKKIYRQRVSNALIISQSFVEELQLIGSHIWVQYMAPLQIVNVHFSNPNGILARSDMVMTSRLDELFNIQSFRPSLHRLAAVQGIKGKRQNVLSKNRCSLNCG